MSEQKAYAEGYLKGYEEGLREAWEELLALTNKGYTSREIQLLAKSLKSAILEKVERKRKGLAKEIQFSEPIEEVPIRIEMTTKMDAPRPLPEFELAPGALTILKDKRLDQPIAALKQQRSAGVKPLCILRTHPDIIRKKYDIDCAMVWLTKTESCTTGDEKSSIEYVSPTELPRLNSVIKSFLTENKGGAILLEGLEYLVTQNDFKSVLKFISAIKDQVILARATFIMPFDPTVLDPKDLKALERETE